MRVDSALYSGYDIPPTYDSLIAKVIVHGRSRNECMMRLRRALEEFVVEGVETTIPLHQALLANPDFTNGDYDVTWLEQFLDPEMHDSLQLFARNLEGEPICHMPRNHLAQSGQQTSFGIQDNRLIEGWKKKA